MNVKVQKRDGKLEEYEDRKIGRVVIACGLKNDEAEKLVSEINGWVSQYDGQTIQSKQIRDKIIELMPKYSEYSARQYSWWETYKDRYKIV